MSNTAAAATLAIRDRLGGPGGLYNLGNGLGLIAGLAVATAGVQGGTAHGVAAALAGALAGSPAALLTTTATAIFFISGEAYHRGAASGSAQPTFWGDLTSGVGASVLGAALVALGDPLLAATSGLLHAVGKFGSAALARHATTTARTARLSDLFRLAVLASRAPGLMVAAHQIAGPAAQGRRPIDLVLPATMLACYALWSLADAALLQRRPHPAFRPAGRQL